MRSRRIAFVTIERSTNCCRPDDVISWRDVGGLELAAADADVGDREVVEEDVANEIAAGAAEVDLQHVGESGVVEAALRPKPRACDVDALRILAPGGRVLKGVLDVEQRVRAPGCGRRCRSRIDHRPSERRIPSLLVRDEAAGALRRLLQLVVGDDTLVLEDLLQLPCLARAYTASPLARSPRPTTTSLDVFSYLPPFASVRPCCDA